MQLVQWNPFREMDEMINRFRSAAPRSAAAAGPLADWAPAVDIKENGKEYLVKAELPGVKKDDVKVATQNGVLTLSGERKFEKEDKDEKHHRIETAYGSFTRSFVLPDDVVAEKIVAEYKEGMLNIHLPKADIAKSSGKQIKVS